MSEPDTKKQNSTTIGERDSQEFPEGGRGWLVIFGMWVIMGTSYGIINAYGEYQAHYVKMFPGEKQSILTLIGSLQPFMIYMMGIPAVMLINKMGPRFVISLGGFIMVLSLMMISLCTQIWQLFLAQGVLFGCGCGLCVFAAFALPQQWFKKKRALAVGICASGSSIGGMVWPIAFSRLVEEVGFAWANRIIGFIYIPLIVVAVIAAKSRDTEAPVPIPQSDANDTTTTDEESSGDADVESQVMSSNNHEVVDEKEQANKTIPPSKPPLIEWSVLNDKFFILYLISNTVSFFALFPPLFFLPSYAASMNASPNITKYILTIANAGSVIGRILPGFVGDKIGRVNSLIPCLFFSGLTTLVFWLPCRGDALLVVFAITFGISSGAVVSLGPATLGQLFGVANLKSRLSLFMLLSGPGCLAGPSISGAFLPSGTNSGIEGYYKAQIFCGVLFFVSASVLVVLRLLISKKLFDFV